MITKIAHIADIHFRNIQRHSEFRAICENFVDQMRRIKPERIVIAGDLVHSRNQISPELVNELSWFLLECSKVTGKVVIIPGNHDIVEQNKERMDAITPIHNALDVDNIVYYKKSGLYQDENVVWSVFSIFDNHMPPENLEMRPYEGTYVGLYHGTIVGATNEMGFKFTHGAELTKFSSCDVVLCGDIHKRQVFRVGKTPVIMVGSFIQQNFGETVSEHGFNVVSLGTEITYEFHDIENPVKYLTFKISDISDIEEQNELLINA
jgi:DNA repair exonuclease SbcCD nuclease subunit